MDNPEKNWQHRVHKKKKYVLVTTSAHKQKQRKPVSFLNVSGH